MAFGGGIRVLWTLFLVGGIFRQRFLSTTMQAGIVITGKQDFLCRGIENQTSAYSSLYLSNFLSVPTLNNDFFVEDFSTIMPARMVISGIQVMTTCCIVG